MIKIISTCKYISYKIMSVFIMIVMVLSQLSNVTLANESFVTLDISKGSIVITSTGYSQGNSKEIP
ncbi:hypothetical protein BFT35_04875 [Thermoanaerobacterium thermosaccharolyticum]|uniref:Uncharacterized protein n=1 Tax=Thermoanaerobacterium thermosaccharolyticum M0795 TaxID=698948 RepID=L0IIA4_THETR|nr:hypothetical protein [Thermoanaerobacterium thermosaccharolyticum]AGB17966.1 hypothetical protein Thethe_00233 [Thermoanaerobacterium thermosaccharolyticum M0795]PHO07605.1 hypothetical protein BFT35_04875 [Thermoanaerobacterium thermosaccharolyticum]